MTDRERVAKSVGVRQANRKAAWLADYGPERKRCTKCKQVLSLTDFNMGYG